MKSGRLAQLWASPLVRAFNRKYVPVDDVLASLREWQGDCQLLGSMVRPDVLVTDVQKQCAALAAKLSREIDRLTNDGA